MRYGAAMSSQKLLGTGALLVALGVTVAGCKGSEPAKEPEPAPSQAPMSPPEAADATGATAPAPPGSATATVPSLHPLTMKRLDGTDAALSAWAGKVVLIVNTA